MGQNLPSASKSGASSNLLVRLQNNFTAPDVPTQHLHDPHVRIINTIRSRDYPGKPKSKSLLLAVTTRWTILKTKWDLTDLTFGKFCPITIFRNTVAI